MKFLVDNQLPPALARFIAEDLSGEAIHVRDVHLERSSDAMLWAYAAEHDLTIISKDEDFIGLLTESPGVSFLWVRLPLGTLAQLPPLCTALGFRASVATDQGTVRTG